ncbi:MAG: hypothetical protein HXY50_11310 [Ignavibacteriaceae bacterium]|nr:hypothetical protein [Ignavibacteriaceae bacterium]
MKKAILFFSYYYLTALFTSSYAQITDNKLNKILTDDNSKYTNIGNAGLTVTNFGTYGHGFALWPQQPSAEYPLGSGIEHIFDGGLWIGAFVANDSLGNGKSGPFVTTGAVDASSLAAKGGGFEFTNAAGEKVLERSSLLDSRFYSPDAISHQDFTMDFVDTNLTWENGELIENHIPLGIAVHQECYAWNFPFADFFVIMNYSIKNVSKKYLDSVYVGLWTDAVVRNTRITSPRSGGSFFNKGGNGFSDSMSIAYEFDATGDVGFSDSYIGIQYLGSTPSLSKNFLVGIDTIPSVNFTSWQFRNTDDPNFFAPQTDQDRYLKLQGYFDLGGNNRFGKGINPSTLQLSSNRSILISSGHYESIAPGDSINVVFAIVFAKKFGTDPASLDSKEQKFNLFNNAEWALRAYYGEDRNRNGILDLGEDGDANGKITRYILPAPPDIPVVKVIPYSTKAEIYWDRRAELSVDPISGKKDFEGYRIYRTQTGFDINNVQNTIESLTLLAEFDSTSNDIGFNSGFNFIKLDEPVTFAGDNTEYWYKFEVDNLMNGWQYLFSVTAFDKGDEENNLSSLESSLLSNLNRILPGTLPNDQEKLEIGVYPNPYYGNAIWDGPSERLRKIYFFNLPSECEITIYTLSGDIVKRMEHNSENSGSNIRWFEQYAGNSKETFSGGEHAWDLISDEDQAIATGLYLFTVKNKKSGNIKTGKFLVIK